MNSDAITAAGTIAIFGAIEGIGIAMTTNAAIYAATNGSLVSTFLFAATAGVTAASSLLSHAVSKDAEDEILSRPSRWGVRGLAITGTFLIAAAAGPSAREDLSANNMMILQSVMNMGR